MNILKEILELYKGLLYMNTDIEEEDRVNIENISLSTFPSVEPEELEEVKTPSEGDVIEIFPSFDNIEMIFLVLKIKREYYHLIPLSRFWEMATPEDVLIRVKDKTYIAQTDLTLSLPKDRLEKISKLRTLFKIGEIEKEALSRIRRVEEGKEKGDGKIGGGPKKEFKELEAKRYTSLFQTEENIKILKSLKEDYLSLAASLKEKNWGEKEEVRWFYDEEEETLLVLPEKKLIGKLKKIVIEHKEGEIILFAGKLPPKVEIPLSKDLYSFKAMEEHLRIEDV